MIQLTKSELRFKTLPTTQHLVVVLLNIWQKKNFQNVYIVPDWPDRLRQTQIIVQQGDQEAATLLKKVLGLGKVEASSTGDLESDLTIRIGEDWLDKKF